MIGQFDGELSTGNAKVTTKFILVRHGKCILGNVTARELGVLHIGPPVAPRGTSCNEVTLLTSLRQIILKCLRGLENWEISK